MIFFIGSHCSPMICHHSMGRVHPWYEWYYKLIMWPVIKRILGVYKVYNCVLSPSCYKSRVHCGPSLSFACIRLCNYSQLCRKVCFLGFQLKFFGFEIEVLAFGFFFKVFGTRLLGFTWFLVKFCGFFTLEDTFTIALPSKQKYFYGILSLPTLSEIKQV